MTALGSASYFDQVAKEYLARYDAPTPGGYALRVRQQRVLELLDKRGGKILDVGCGPGKMAPSLLERGFEFWGVDAAPGMIEQCKREFGNQPRTHFSIGDASNLFFEDVFFDSVICMGVIDRVQNWEVALKEMSRVLKPGGTLIISFPNLLSPYAWWKNFVFYLAMAIVRPIYFRLRGRPQPPALYNRVDMRGRMRLLWSSANLQTARTVSRFINGLGMHVTDVVYYNFDLLLSPLDELFPRVSMKLSERFERLRCGKFRWIGAGYIVKARQHSEDGQTIQ